MMCLEKSTSKPSLILGYTTRRHLLLDLDDTTLIKATRLIDMIFKEWPEVGDVLVLISSKGNDRIDLIYDKFNWPFFKRFRYNYHLVFDNLIGYNKACKICETLAEISLIDKGYSRIRKFRGDLTLRLTPKIMRSGVQGHPRILKFKTNPHKKNKDDYISKYLYFLGIARSLIPLDFITKGIAYNSGDSGNHRA